MNSAGMTFATYKEHQFFWYLTNIGASGMDPTPILASLSKPSSRLRALKEEPLKWRKTF